MPDHGLLVDYEYCTGCHACEVACKQEHRIPARKAGGIKIIELIQELPGGKDNSSMDTVIPPTHNRDLSGQVAGILTERVVGDLLLKDRRPRTDGSVPYVFF